MVKFDRLSTKSDYYWLKFSNIFQKVYVLAIKISDKILIVLVDSSLFCDKCFVSQLSGKLISKLLLIWNLKILFSLFWYVVKYELCHIVENRKYLKWEREKRRQQACNFQKESGWWFTWHESEGLTHWICCHWLFPLSPLCEELKIDWILLHTLLPLMDSFRSALHLCCGCLWNNCSDL
jgi:hypothetical protein